jgi:hypothetical protein
MFERTTHHPGTLGATVDRAATLYFEALGKGITPTLMMVNDVTYDELIRERESDLARGNPMMLLDMDVRPEPDRPIGEPRLTVRTGTVRTGTTRTGIEGSRDAR